MGYEVAIREGFPNSLHAHHMLIGEYNHILDAKKRIALPAKFRKEVGSKVVVTQGLDRCLFVYTMSEWEKIASKLASLPMGAADTRSFNRHFLAGAVETEVDAIGRILIPDYLKAFAKLGTKIAIIGVYTRIELWDEKAWNEYKAKAAGSADSQAEKLGELGVL